MGRQYILSKWTYYTTQITPPANLSGFSFIGTHAGSHYYISQNNEVWTDADSICASLGGTLVCISDTAENNFISSHINEYVWIGLNDEQNEGTFVWTNGDPAIQIGYQLSGCGSQMGKITGL